MYMCVYNMHMHHLHISLVRLYDGYLLTKGSSLVISLVQTHQPQIYEVLILVQTLFGGKKLLANLLLYKHYGACRRPYVSIAPSIHLLWEETPLVYFKSFGEVWYRKDDKSSAWRPLLLNHYITCEYCDSFACSIAAIYFATSNTLCVILSCSVDALLCIVCDNIMARFHMYMGK